MAIDIMKGIFSMSSHFFAEVINSWGTFAVVASLLLSIVVAIAGILPSIFVTGANVLIFGPINGFILSWAGEAIGAAVSFHLYRLGFKKNFESLGRRHKIFESIVTANGFRAALLLFQARLLPFVPSGVVTLAGAVSNVNFIYFLIATILGKLPSIALEALVGYDLINLNRNWIRLVITVIAVGSMLLLLKRSKPK